MSKKPPEKLQQSTAEVPIIDTPLGDEDIDMSLLDIPILTTFANTSADGDSHKKSVATQPKRTHTESE
jgi:hypothetical protein